MNQPISVGSHVLYGKMGVCLVHEQRTMKIGKESSLYYVLCPISDGRSSVYVPCDNEELVARMRPLLTREEIDALLSGADEERLQWIDDRNARSDLYRSVAADGDRRRLIRVICCLFRKKHERQEAGKRLSTMDESALQDCVRLIDEEFSLVLGIPRTDVMDYILERL